MDVRLAAVKAVQGVLEGDEIEDEGREEVGSDLVGKACHVSFGLRVLVRSRGKSWADVEHQ